LIFSLPGGRLALLIPRQLRHWVWTQDLHAVHNILRAFLFQQSRQTQVFVLSQSSGTLCNRGFISMGRRNARTASFCPAK